MKIPATKQGLPAITEVIANGINVNVTLIFSLERYSQVIDAYLLGLEQRINSGLPIKHIHSVASFFISRIDIKIDKLLEMKKESNSIDQPTIQKLKGKTAVANARLAYQQFKHVFSSERFKNLVSAGANLQRPLWASTSTKNPNYSDILYVQELIGNHTVNTIPNETLSAFLDHGKVFSTIENDVEEAKKVLEMVETLGISLGKVTQELEDEGVQLFSNSFESLMNSIKDKASSL
jgi:transaldolase